MRTGEMLKLQWKDIDLLNVWVEILRVDIPQLRQPPASVTAGQPQVLGEHIEKGGASLLPDLLPEAHVCFQVDERGCSAAYDCADARALIDADRSQVCTGSGPEPTRCDEEIGRTEEVTYHRSTNG